MCLTSNPLFPAGNDRKRQCDTYVRWLAVPLALVFAIAAAMIATTGTQAQTATIDDGEVDDLIAAIEESNANAETPAEIELAEGGNYTLHEAYGDSDFDQARIGLPVISSEITIVGNGATIARESLFDPDQYDPEEDENNVFRIFEVASAGELNLTDVTVSNGLTDVGFQSGAGAGINNAGTLALTRTTVSDNTSGFLENDFGNVERERGGGIYNDFGASLTIDSSTVSSNTAESGGGVFNSQDATLTVTDTTVSDNVADLAGGGIHNFFGDAVAVDSSTVSGNEARLSGGGIHSSGELELHSSTVSGNSAGSSGGGINSSGQLHLISSTIFGNDAAFGGFGIHVQTGTSAMLLNTIVAGDADQQCDGADDDLVSEGHNLATDNTCNLHEDTDFPETDPANLGLEPLEDNGGPTLTHALPEDSLAIDEGLPEDHDECADTTDQRGVERPQGAACDIGSYELEVEEADDPVAPDEQIQALISDVEDADVHRENQLTNALESAEHHLDHGRTAQACHALDRFVKHVERQRGQQKGLSDDEADAFIESAREIQEELDC